MIESKQNKNEIIYNLNKSYINTNELAEINKQDDCNLKYVKNRIGTVITTTMKKHNHHHYHHYTTTTTTIYTTCVDFFLSCLSCFVFFFDKEEK